MRSIDWLMFNDNFSNISALPWCEFFFIINLNTISISWHMDQKGPYELLSSLCVCQHPGLLSFHISTYFLEIIGANGTKFVILISFENLICLPSLFSFLMCWNFRYLFLRGHMWWNCLFAGMFLIRLSNIFFFNILSIRNSRWPPKQNKVITYDNMEKQKDSFSQKSDLRVRVMVFNTTFNNISFISWCQVLLVEETRVPEENHRSAASHW